MSDALGTIVKIAAGRLAGSHAEGIKRIHAAAETRANGEDLIAFALLMIASNLYDANRLAAAKALLDREPRT